MRTFSFAFLVLVKPWPMHPLFAPTRLGLSPRLRTNAEETEKSGSGTGVTRRHHQDFSNDHSPQLQDLFNEAIAVNSMAFQDVDPES